MHVAWKLTSDGLFLLTANFPKNSGSILLHLHGRSFVGRMDLVPHHPNRVLSQQTENNGLDRRRILLSRLRSLHPLLSQHLVSFILTTANFV